MRVNNAITCWPFVSPLQFRLTQSCYCLPRGTNWLFCFFSALRGCRELFFYFRYTILTIQTVYVQRSYAENIRLYCRYSAVRLCGSWCRGIRRFGRNFCGDSDRYRFLIRLLINKKVTANELIIYTQPECTNALNSPKHTSPYNDSAFG